MLRGGGGTAPPHALWQRPWLHACTRLEGKQSHAGAPRKRRAPAGTKEEARPRTGLLNIALGRTHDIVDSTVTRHATNLVKRRNHGGS